MNTGGGQVIGGAATTELQPEVLRQVRREWRQQDQQRAQSLTGKHRPAGVQVAAHGVAELHQLRHSRIELIVAVKVFADGLNGGVHGPAQLLLVAAEGTSISWCPCACQ